MVIKFFVQISFVLFCGCLCAMSKIYKPYKVKAFSSMNRVEMRQAFYEFLDSAQEKMRVSIFTFCDKEVARRLILAQERGVNVEVIMQEPKDFQVQRMLKFWKVPLFIFRSSDGAIMHNKYVIVDGRRVWTGSMNFTRPAYDINFENALLLYGRALARYYDQDFEHTKSKIEERLDLEQKKLNQQQYKIRKEREEWKEMISAWGRAKK